MATSQTPPNHDELLTTAEAGRMFRVHPQTIRRWIDAGALEAVRPGRAYRVRRASVAALLEQTAEQ